MTWPPTPRVVQYCFYVRGSSLKLQVGRKRANLGGVAGQVGELLLTLLEIYALPLEACSVFAAQISKRSLFVLRRRVLVLVTALWVNIAGTNCGRCLSEC